MFKSLFVSKLTNKVQSSFVQKIIKGTFLLSLGSFVSRGLIAIAYIVLAKILTQYEYGEYGMIKSTIDNFLVFASMGIGLTTTKYISELKKDESGLTSSILGTSLVMVFSLSLVIFIIILFSSDYISIEVWKNQDLKVPLILSGIIIMFISLNSVQTGAFLGLQHYKQILFLNIIQGLLILIGLTIGGYTNGVIGAVVGYLFASFILLIITSYSLRITCKKINLNISFNYSRYSFQKIYKFALPASLSSIIVAPVTWILNTLLVNEPNGYSQLGIYSAVIIFSLAIQLIYNALSNALLPIFLSKDTELTIRKEFFNYFGGFLITLLIAFPLLLFPEIVSYILGDKYSIDELKIILGLSLISTIIMSHRQGTARDLILKNKMWLSVFSMGQWGITCLILFYFLKSYGAVGLSITLCLSYFINMIIFVPFFIQKKISPEYIFFNKWLFLVFILIVILYGSGMLLGSFVLRFLLVPFFIYLICLFFKKMYKQICLES